MIDFFLSIPFFLCWGSFLNVIAVRLLSGQSLFDLRSQCPACKTTLKWYDLIPVISWLLLQGKCRYCQQTISWLYPFTELITALVFCVLLYVIPTHYWFGYSLFVTALIIVTRTDLQEWLIPQFMTVYLIPIALICGYYQLIPISMTQSMIGSLSAYIFLWTVASIYFLITKKVGLGQGDVELLALIGAFTGFIGWWFTITMASLAASGVGLILLFSKKLTRNTKLPFGPFLALGAILYLFCSQTIMMCLF